MSTVPHTTTNPMRETPSTSDTAIGGSAGANLYPKGSTPAADISNNESKVGMTSNQGQSTTSNQPGSAEAAAEKLYEQRIEEEYAKREGAIALYRALLSQCRALRTIGSQQRNELQNIVRNRFQQARHLHSARRLTLNFEAGYEAIDYLDAAVAGDEASRAYILDLLARAPDKAKQSPPITLSKAILKEAQKQLCEKPAGQPSVLDRPLPLEQLSGKRHVPKLYNAQGIPLLRFKKPQPENLSGYINHRGKQQQKRHDTRLRLEREVALAAAEDDWDRIVAEHTGMIPEDLLTNGRLWTDEAATAHAEVNAKLDAERAKNHAWSEKLQRIVDQEQELYDAENKAWACLRDTGSTG